MLNVDVFIVVNLCRCICIYCCCSSDICRYVDINNLDNNCILIYF